MLIPRRVERAHGLGCLALMFAAALAVYGQSQSGQVSGVVADGTGAVVAGAKVQLIHQLTKNTREFTTETNGAFVFADVLPGNYNLRVQFPGFKIYEQAAINISSDERVDLHQIALTVGASTDSVEVTAQAARIETSSSERSGLITPTQVENTPNRGRDYLGLLRVLPGVVDANNRDAPGASGAPQVNGGQAGQFVVTLDGLPNQDVGATGNSGFITPNVDAIGEVKVMLSGSQAEFGSRSGGQMSVTIKGGTNQFHGSGYYFWRHEMFNANSWNNDKLGIAKPPYRFKNPGYTLGGPVLIPGTNFNRSRTKLFFFWAHDILLRQSSTLSTITFPTAAERGGDFSQSYDSVTLQPITLKDPTTGAPIPGNHLPANLQSAAGSALLNLFPMSNTTDPSGRHGYNTQYTLPVSNPANNEILRVDWNVNSKTMAYARYIRDVKGTDGPCAVYLICFVSGFGSGTSWPMLNGGYDIHSNNVLGTVVHTFSPTLVNELTFGTNLVNQAVTVGQTQLSAFTRKSTGLTQSLLPSFYPAANPLNLIPDVQFVTANGGGSIGNVGSYGFDNRFPFNGTERVDTLINNLSYVRSGHNFKAGVYYERTDRYSKRGAANGGGAANLGLFNGFYDFGSDPYNGYDTGWGFANALGGVVKQYQESNRTGIGEASYHRLDWFAQDNWKVSRRLTIDIGVRFTAATPGNSVGQPISLFIPSTYSTSANPRLILPACKAGVTSCPSGANRIAIDPATGQLLPQTLIGALSNAGGTAYQAATVFQGSYFHNPPIAVSPRFGFAWDVLGNGKLAVRGGFDILYDSSVSNDDNVLQLTDVPPATLIQTLNYTTLANMQTAPNYYRVANMYAGQRDFKLPSTLDWHFGVQRDLGAGIVADVSYVANTTRHQPTTVDLNAIAPGTTWSGSTFTAYNPAVQDKTNVSGGLAAPLPTNFLRPYQGYGSITYFQWNGDSNYNAMQASVNRRFGKRLTFIGNYTFSRTLNYAKTPFYSDRLTYSPGNTRKNNFNFSWTYQIPDGSQLWKNAVTRAALDGWQLTGIFTAISGSSATVSYTVTGTPSGFNFSGSPTTGISRIQISNSVPLFQAPQNSQDSGLNPAAFSIPALSQAGLGNAPPVLFWGPGSWGVDASIFKIFKIKEKVDLEFRMETYNTLNHPNYGNPNTTYQTAWNNGNFGPNVNAYFGSYLGSNGQVAITSTARVAVLAMKVRF
jgi:Carboxypeptidase regulatory-like domain